MAYFRELDQLLMAKRMEAILKLPSVEQEEVVQKGCALYTIDAVIARGSLYPGAYDVFYAERKGEMSHKEIFTLAAKVLSAVVEGAGVQPYGSRAFRGIDGHPSKLPRQLQRRAAEEMVGRLGTDNFGIVLLSKSSETIGHASCLIRECTKSGLARHIIYADPGTRRGSELLTPRQAANVIRRKQVDGCILGLNWRLRTDSILKEFDKGISTTL